MNSVMFKAMNADDMSARMLRGYHAGFQQTFADHSEKFHWLEQETLVQSNRIFVLAIEDAEVTAGLFYDRKGSNIHLMGLFSNSQLRGLAKRAIAEAFRFERTQTTEEFTGSANVRVLPNGEVNAAACRSFTQMGFYAHSVEEYKIAFDNKDRHLVGTANRHQDGKYFFLSQKMTARSTDVFARSSDLLTNGRAAA